MVSKQLTPLIVIVGPTASGKSDLAMRAAKAVNGEIICVDSRTVYKGMDIGTAKPSKQDQTKVRHHLLDVVEPNERFTAADFQREANKAIDVIGSRGHIPIMVGGTGLYIDSILFNYEFGSVANEEVRQALNRMTEADLYEYCIKNNVELPANVKNRRHLIRAIEQWGINRKRSTVMRANTLVVGISTNRIDLRKRIEARAEVMFKKGVVKEALNLAKKYDWDNEAMSGNIYRLIRRMSEGDLTEKQTIELFVTSDMQLAKRQMTWFKRNKDIIWDSDSDNLLKKIVKFAKQYSLE